MPFLESLKFIEVIRDDSNLLTATPYDVISGKGFVGKGKKIQYGEIPIIEQTSNVLLTSGQSYNVAYGYNPREYTISAETLSNQTNATGTAGDILNQKTAWVNGVLITGTMPNIGSQSTVLNAGEQVVIEKGYHNGEGIILSKSLSEQTYGTAKDMDILVGKLAWINGIQVAGIMPDIVPTNVSLNASQSYTIPNGYHKGTAIVSAVNLAIQTQATATESDIAFGKTGWVNGILITGTIPRITASSVVLPLNGSYTIPSGIHSGLGIVTQNIQTLAGLTITPAFEKQIIDVKEKYMTDNIVVTGIDALNFKNFTSSTGLLFDNDVSFNGSVAGNTLAYTATDDNWHDQVTNNVYAITTTKDGKVVHGTIFANNLNADAIDTTKVYISDDISIVYKNNASTNAHEFYVSSDGTGTSGSTIHLNIREVMSLRRYGDEHDI